MWFYCCAVYPQLPPWSNRNRKEKSVFFLFLSLPSFVHVVSSSLLPWFVIPFHSSFLPSFFVYQISMNSPRESWTWVWDTGSRNLKCLHIRLLARFSWAFWKRHPFLSIDLWFIYKINSEKKINSVLQRFSWGSRTQDSILPCSIFLLTKFCSSASPYKVETGKLKEEKSCLLGGNLWAYVYHNFTLELFKDLKATANSLVTG